MAAFPSLCAPQEVQSGSAADWRPPKSGSGYPATKGTDPETELSGRRCYATATSGLHRSWWTPVYARSGNRLHSAQPCRTPRAPTGRLLDGILPLQRRAHASATKNTGREVTGPGVRERCSMVAVCLLANRLCKSLRSPVSQESHRRESAAPKIAKTLHAATF